MEIEHEKPVRKHRVPWPFSKVTTTDRAGWWPTVATITRHFLRLAIIRRRLQVRLSTPTYLYFSTLSILGHRVMVELPEIFAANVFARFIPRQIYIGRK